MLLSDRVFSQMPKAVKRLIEFVAADAGFDRICSNEIFRPDGGMALPAQAGGLALFAKCTSRGSQARMTPLCNRRFARLWPRMVPASN